MGHVRYFVIPHDENWLVTLEGRRMARVATRREAINSAIVMADLMGSMGYDADVMLDEGEKLTLIWIYGKNRVRGSHPRRVVPRKSASRRSHIKPVEMPA
ncbi:MAG TPA: hypothetical protein VIN06_16485 [Devosia sp.]